MSGAPAPPGDQRHDEAPQEPTRSQKRKNENSNDDEPNTKLGTTFSCRFCTKVFAKRQALGGHMNKHRLDREKEKFQRAQELVKKDEQQQLLTSHSSNLCGGGLATQNSSETEIAHKPLGITSPELAFGEQLFNISPAYYHHAMELTHCNMSVPSLRTLNSMMQFNSGNDLQQIPDNSRWNEDSNIDSNVPLAQFSMSVPSSPYLNSMMESDSSGIHLEQFPGNSNWSQDSNMHSNVPGSASALQNELTPNSLNNHVLADEILNQNGQFQHDVVPNPHINVSDQ